jgi:hypothetical protein
MIEILFACIAVAAVALVAISAPGVIRVHLAWKRRQAALRAYSTVVAALAPIFDAYTEAFAVAGRAFVQLVEEVNALNNKEIP